MSSPAEQFPPDPDDPDHDARGPDAGAHEHAHRRRHTLQEHARTTLARKVAKAQKAHRSIAKANAKRARVLADLQQWSSDPVNAKLLNPDYALDGVRGPVLTDAQASPRKIAAWEDQEIARRTVTSEVACALRLADRTAENLIGESALFAGPMTLTLTAMSQGEISYRHGQVLMEQLSFIPLEEAAELEAELLPAAKDLTVGKLKVKARRLREHRHPDTLTKRATAAVAERGVWWEGRPDGMGTLTWYGTATQTQAAHDRLTHIAQSTQDAERQDAERQDDNIPEDQRRTISQICADAMADLVLDGVTPSGTGGGIHGQVMVTVPVLTLLGRTEEPGFLEGYGPIPADVAREIAGGAPSFTRLLTHPETGAVLSVGKEHYTVPADLRRWLRLRDGTCRFPAAPDPPLAARSTTPQRGNTAAPPTTTTSPTSAAPTTGSNTRPCGRSCRNPAEYWSGPPRPAPPTAPTPKPPSDHQPHNPRNRPRQPEHHRHRIGPGQATGPKTPRHSDGRPHAKEWG